MTRKERKKAEEERLNKELIDFLYPPGSASSVIIEIEQERPVLIRPKPRYLRVLLYVLSALALSAVCGVAAKYIYRAAYPPAAEGTARFSSVSCGFVSSAAVLLVEIFFARKKILIWFVRLYQYYASDDVRLRCVYTPSCSNYMILSIEKYGVIRGVYKGWKRLQRCHYPNGGEDYP